MEFILLDTLYIKERGRDMEEGKDKEGGRDKGQGMG